MPDGAIEACPWAEQPNGSVQEALFVRYALIAAAEVRVSGAPAASLGFCSVLECVCSYAAI